MNVQLKINNVTLPTPSSYSYDMEDLDGDSFRSVTTGSLIRNVIGYKWFKGSFSWNGIDDTKHDTILQATKNADSVSLEFKLNNVTIANVTGYVSKTHGEYIQTGSDNRWNISFNFVEGTR